MNYEYTTADVIVCFNEEEIVVEVEVRKYHEPASDDGLQPSFTEYKVISWKPELDFITEGKLYDLIKWDSIQWD